MVGMLWNATQECGNLALPPQAIPTVVERGFLEPRPTDCCRPIQGIVDHEARNSLDLKVDVLNSGAGAHAYPKLGAMRLLMYMRKAS